TPAAPGAGEPAQAGGFARLVTVGARDLAALGDESSRSLDASPAAAFDPKAAASAATLWQLRSESDLPCRTLATLRRAADVGQLGEVEARAVELASGLLRRLLEEDRLDIARAALAEL